jgi:8-oxo-dGTP pyrophosphatase MutT (NUDIX family)
MKIFEAKSVQQVAVLPFIVSEDGIEILLITSRSHGLWILPKGWPMKGLTLPSAAAAEAGEEAGVRGVMDETPIGDYSYSKLMKAGYTVRCHVFVYPMLVREHRLTWPEQGQRELKWCRLGEARALTEEPGLGYLFEQLTGATGKPLAAMAETFGEDLSDYPQIGAVA